MSSYCRSPRSRRALRQVDPDRMPVGGSSRETRCGKRPPFGRRSNDSLVILGVTATTWDRGRSKPPADSAFPWSPSHWAMMNRRVFDDDGGWVVYDETEVWSVRNDKQMKDLARATDGIHVPLGTSVVDARALWRQRPLGGWFRIGPRDHQGSSGMALVCSPWCLVAWPGFNGRARIA